MEDFVKISYSKDKGYKQGSKNIYCDIILKDEPVFPDVIKEQIYEHLIIEYSILIREISNCESPVEQLLALSLKEFKTGYLSYKLNEKNIEIIDIEKQTKIGNYRVDFLIVAYNQESRIEKQIIVEVDGYEYHEKNKKQFIEEKVRDRYFVSNGYTVLHFAGSEVFSNYEKCTQDVFNTIIKIFSN